MSTINSKAVVISSILLIISGLLPFLDNLLKYIFIPFDINLRSIKVPYFENLNTAIWTLSSMLSPLLIIISIFLKPYKLLYIYPFFTYSILFFSSLLSVCGVLISGMLQFKVFVLIFSVITILTMKRTYNYITASILSDKIKIDIIETFTKEEDEI